MDQRMFLSILLGIWLGMLLYWMTKGIIRAVVSALSYRSARKAHAKAVYQKKANETGRIIGFRPIENERT